MNKNYLNKQFRLTVALMAVGLPTLLIQLDRAFLIADNDVTYFGLEILPYYLAIGWGLVAVIVAVKFFVAYEANHTKPRYKRA